MIVQGQFVIVRVVAEETVYVTLFCTTVVAPGQYVVYAVTTFGHVRVCDFILIIGHQIPGWYRQCHCPISE
jgi:hypothetical protein